MRYAGRVTAQPQTLREMMVGAFPWEYRDAAEAVVDKLEPFVDDTYRQALVPSIVLGQSVAVLRRIHFTHQVQPPAVSQRTQWLIFQCLWTRSTDGYARQAALRLALESKEPAVIPFIVLLAGEYVIEIIEDILAAAPSMDRAIYADFVQENRQLMRNLRAKATSYWDCYYRHRYPDKKSYPGLAFLHEVER